MSQLRQGETPVQATSRDSAILAYTRKLTSIPWEITENDLANMKKHGLDDTAILQVNLIVDYFNFVNRLALGLGVELEDYWPPIIT
jgi:alkylhydroperoxidase family enzyme